jgi:hypothetical protein
MQGPIKRNLTTILTPHLNTQHTLAQHDVTHGTVNVQACGITRGHHVAILELHALGTLGTQLARYNDLQTSDGR